MQRLSPRLVSWASLLDPATEHQAHETAKLSCVWPYLALMPDAHLGSGATVGSVIPQLGSIIPSAVGVDIGCGMVAGKTQWNADNLRSRGNLTLLREAIERSIPSSMGNYNTHVRDFDLPFVQELEEMPGYASAREISPNWRLQLGSLGGGNHFIEITRDQDDGVWIFLHSGSRGVGNRLAQKHIKTAIEYDQTHHIAVPNRDLSYLLEGTPEFDAYITDLRWAQRFAELNRRSMFNGVMDALKEFMGDYPLLSRTVACHHNYTEHEEHFGEKVWLSRKGAISAKSGEWGLIPGSMGSASYVVTGKGNHESFMSAPHGAGRNFSRRVARDTFTMGDLEKSMEGIEWRHSSALVDEIPGAYKPIDVVMRDAEDLVDIKYTLHQIINVKGD